MTCIFVTQFRRDAELAAGLGVAVGLIGIEMVRYHDLDNKNDSHDDLKLVDGMIEKWMCRAFY